MRRRKLHNTAGGTERLTGQKRSKLRVDLGEATEAEEYNVQPSVQQYSTAKVGNSIGNEESFYMCVALRMLEGYRLNSRRQCKDIIRGAGHEYTVDNSETKFVLDWKDTINEESIKNLAQIASANSYGELSVDVVQDTYDVEQHRSVAAELLQDQYYKDVRTGHMQHAEAELITLTAAVSTHITDALRKTTQWDLADIDAIVRMLWSQLAIIKHSLYDIVYAKQRSENRQEFELGTELILQEDILRTIATRCIWQIATALKGVTDPYGNLQLAIRRTVTNVQRMNEEVLLPEFVVIRNSIKILRLLMSGIGDSLAQLDSIARLSKKEFDDILPESNHKALELLQSNPVPFIHTQVVHSQDGIPFSITTSVDYPYITVVIGDVDDIPNTKCTYNIESDNFMLKDYASFFSICPNDSKETVAQTRKNVCITIHNALQWFYVHATNNPDFITRIQTAGQFCVISNAAAEGDILIIAPQNVGIFAYDLFEHAAKEVNIHDATCQYTTLPEFAEGYQAFATSKPIQEAVIDIDTQKPTIRASVTKWSQKFGKVTTAQVISALKPLGVYLDATGGKGGHNKLRFSPEHERGDAHTLGGRTNYDQIIMKPTTPWPVWYLFQLFTNLNLTEQEQEAVVSTLWPKAAK